MEIKPIFCKSILSKSYISDYSINPYVGCQHACTYCYAWYYTKKYRKIEKPWGSYVYPKINSLQVLLKEMRKKKKGCVYFSPFTDPYQPVERKYELTKKLIKILISNKWPLFIQTKSPLVLRDIDLLKKGDVEIGFTIITLKEKIRKIFEPNAPSIKERIKALKVLKESGLSTFSFIGPILPFLTDREVENLIKKVSKYSNRIFLDRLNLKPGLWEKIKKVLSENFPSLEEKWKVVLKARSNYYEKIKEKIKKKFGSRVELIFCF